MWTLLLCMVVSMAVVGYCFLHTSPTTTCTTCRIASRSKSIHTKRSAIGRFMTKIEVDTFTNQKVSNHLNHHSFSIADQSSVASPATLASTSTAIDTYIYEPPTVGAEIWIGSIVAVIPIIWATFEFVGRIRVQQRCAVCQGSGLTSVSKAGKPLSRLRKCWNCGGFLPWLGWKMFFLSTKEVGNGGVLQRPAKDYAETNAKWNQVKNNENEAELFDAEESKEGDLDAVTSTPNEETK